MPIPLIVPGLYDSGPDHWQTWLGRRLPYCRRVEQPDWSTPDLDRWALALIRHLSRESSPVVLIAHSFGCLAAARVIGDFADRVVGALLVAPADPQHFGIADDHLSHELPARTTLVASRNDPWMNFNRAHDFADNWGSRFVDLGCAGHINVASGHGPWPHALTLLAGLAGGNSRHVSPLTRAKEIAL